MENRNIFQVPDKTVIKENQSNFFKAKEKICCKKKSVMLKISPCLQLIPNHDPNIFKIRRSQAAPVSLKKLKKYEIVGEVFVRNFSKIKRNGNFKTVKRIETGQSVGDNILKQNNQNSGEHIAHIMKKGEILNNFLRKEQEKHKKGRACSKYEKQNCQQFNTNMMDEKMSKIHSEHRKYQSIWNNFGTRSASKHQQGIHKTQGFQIEKQNKKTKQGLIQNEDYRTIWEQNERRSLMEMRNNLKSSFWSKNLRKKQTIVEEINRKYLNIENIKREGLKVKGSRKKDKEIEWISLKNSRTIFTNCEKPRQIQQLTIQLV